MSGFLHLTLNTLLLDEEREVDEELIEKSTRETGISDFHSAAASLFGLKQWQWKGRYSCPSILFVLANTQILYVQYFL